MSLATEYGANLNEWRIIAVDRTGNVLRDDTQTNLVVNTGRINAAIATLDFDVSPTTYTHIGVGASSTAAAVTQDRLIYELTGNANRIAYTKANAGALPFTTGDIANETVVVSGYTFTKKVVIEAVYDFTDGNNGNTFREYGLFNTGTLPGSPTGLSGEMYCRFVDSSPTLKDINTKLIIQVNMRW